MSTYADAAASSGPTGGNVVEPHKGDSQETKQVKKDINNAAEKASDKAEELSKEAKKAGKKATKDVKKELDELEKASAPYLESIANFVKEKYNCLSSTLSSKLSKENLKATGEEFKNPVVLGQLAVIVGGATAGLYVYSERARIRSDNKYVVAIHAGIITGLVLADGFIFSKLYEKSKK